MRSDAFALGVSEALVKVAARADVGEVVYEALAASLAPGLSVSPTDDLDTLLPGAGELERALLFLEDRFDIRFGDRAMTRLFAVGTVDDLVGEIDGRLAKTAAYSHRAYMTRREHHKQRARAYRMAHATQLRRRARVYRNKVRRRIVRPRRRLGSAAGGYQFVMR